MKINIDLSNEELYAGCDIQVLTKGSKRRLNLKTPKQEAVNIVLKNLERMLADQLLLGDVVLTGNTILAVYLAVMGFVSPKATSVVHQDRKEITKVK